MRDDLDKKLCEKYPKIFKNRHADMRETSMCWGFSCEDGWYDLIDMLCSSLQWNTDKNKYPQVIADQVKEKWGSLNFYYHILDLEEENSYIRFPVINKLINNKIEDDYYTSGYISGLIRFAEKMSLSICEYCGSSKSHGTVSIRGWYKSLCTECEEKANAKKR